MYRDILTQQNKSRQYKTRQQREEQENKHDIGGKTLLPNDRERERESYIVRHLQMFSRKFLLLQRASAATP